MAADWEAEVWPDNALAVGVFCDLDTQWRAGPGGFYGLDYNAVPVVLEVSGADRSDWPELFSSIQVMESAALDEMAKARKG